jgi:hypothetical protein
MPHDPAQHDQRRRHCPMLGHEISLCYCRAPAAPLPCGKIFDCWWEHFDVVGFMKDHFTQQQVEQILSSRPDRVTTILGLIEKARKPE